MKKNNALASLLLALWMTAPAFAQQDNASLQFTVAAPDPVMAGEEVKLQTLVVNTGGTTWQRGTYYWIGEIYALEGEDKRFITQTPSLSPAEDGPRARRRAHNSLYCPGHQGRRLHRVFLIKDQRIHRPIIGFQVIEKIASTIPRILRSAATSLYSGTPAGTADNHQGITAPPASWARYANPPTPISSAPTMAITPTMVLLIITPHGESQYRRYFSVAPAFAGRAGYARRLERAGGKLSLIALIGA